LRTGERVTVTVELGRLEEGERLIAQRRNGSGSGGAAEPSEALGLILEALSEQSRKKYEIGDDLEGVLVTAVAPGSSAEEKRVVVGDVIVEVSQEAVTSPSEVVDRVEQLKSEGRRSALLLIAGKGNELRFVAVRIEKESDPEPDGETQQQ
jgi:serine protease Do